VKRRPQLLALCALFALTAAVAGLSRLTLPRRLAPTESLPAPIQGFTHQTAGYIRIPADGAYSVTVFFDGNARLFVDGVAARTFTPAERPDGLPLVPIGAGVHRVHLQFTPPDDRARPPELAWSSGRRPQAIPPEALSPRSLSPLAWRARSVLTPLTIGLAWLWFGTAVWLVAGPFFAWFRGQLSADEVRPVLAILALSLLLGGYGMSWGLPGGWAQDELGTQDILDALRLRFANGWHHRYPPLHFYLLVLVHLPFLAAERLDMIDLWSEASQEQIACMGRALSVVMSVGTAAFVYLVARTMLSIRAAVLASLCWTLVLTAVFYAKLVNLDMPYVFWFTLSLLGYARALTTNATRDYMLYAAGAAAAVCTKDQAYGLYLLPTLYLIVHRVRSVIAGARDSSALALARDPALPAAAATGVLGFALLQGLPFNWSGVEQHFAYITGPGSNIYRMIDSTSPGGQAFLFRRTFDHLVWSMSWPGLLIGAAGIALLVRRQARIAFALLLPAVSYYVTFVAVVGYSYDRFMMPVCLVLSLFAGAALDAAWPPAAPRWRTAAVAAMLTYMALRTTSINVMMAADGRYTVERWLLANVAPDARIGVVEHPVVLPRLRDLVRVTLYNPVSDLPAVRPDFLVVTDNYLTRFPPNAPERDWYGRVIAGQQGYDVVLQHQTRMPWAILALEPRFRHPDGSFTTLHKVNPLVTVLRRRNVP
jgi:hypothetical protein